MSEESPVVQARAHVTRRFRTDPLFQRTMIDQFDRLVSGNFATYLERPDNRELAEEMLFICMHFKVPLICAVRR